jgi:hypothetical protein
VTLVDFDDPVYLLTKPLELFGFPAFWLWVYLMKVIILTLSVPDEGYYFDFERIWWRLFQKRVVCSKFNIYVFIANWSFVQRCCILDLHNVLCLTACIIRPIKSHITQGNEDISLILFDESLIEFSQLWSEKKLAKIDQCFSLLLRLLWIGLWFVLTCKDDIFKWR